MKVGNYMSVREAKQELINRRIKSMATLKDIAVVMECQKIGDYTAVKQTKLYNNHGGEYCELLSIIN